ncbi:MAG: recombinase family protein [Butyrivibrio sp.]|nr:recombinase family protein [Butyrivibrio sp.]
MAEKRRYGYIRVSSNYQNEARQRDAILKEGVLERDLFIDKKSGRDFKDRPELERLKASLVPGDEVVILDLDRLGRNYGEMASVWDDITHNKGCDIIVINYPLLSTVQEEKNLDRRFLADMIFSLLSYVAEKEREEIKARQREGIASAKAEGKRFGRPPIEKPNNFSEIYSRVWNHEITNRQAMEIMNLKESTYYKFASEEERNIREKERSVTYGSNS